MQEKERAEKVISIKCPGCKAGMIYQDSYQNIVCSSDDCAAAASWMVSASGYMIYSFRFPDRADYAGTDSAYEQRLNRFIKKLRDRIKNRKPMANNIPYGNRTIVTEEELAEFLELHELNLKDFNEIRKRGTSRTLSDLAGEYALEEHTVTQIRKISVIKEKEE